MAFTAQQNEITATCKEKGCFYSLVLTGYDTTERLDWAIKEIWKKLHPEHP